MAFELIESASENPLSAKGIRLIQAHDKAVALFRSDAAPKTLTSALV